MSGAYFGNTGVIDVEKAFSTSFGDVVKHDQVYVNPWLKIDKRSDILKYHLNKNKEIQKASILTTTGGAGTAGYALAPISVVPEIVDQTRYLTPLVELVPRRASKGTTYDYNKITAKGGSSWRIEDANATADVDTYDRASVNIKYGYLVGS